MRRGCDQRVTRFREGFAMSGAGEYGFEVHERDLIAEDSLRDAEPECAEASTGYGGDSNTAAGGFPKIALGGNEEDVVAGDRVRITRPPILTGQNEVGLAEVPPA